MKRLILMACVPVLFAQNADLFSRLEWRSVGPASAEPSAATVSSTPSDKIESILIGSTIAEKRTVFQA